MNLMQKAERSLGYVYVSAGKDGVSFTEDRGGESQTVNLTWGEMLELSDTINRALQIQVAEQGDRFWEPRQ